MQEIVNALAATAGEAYSDEEEMRGIPSDLVPLQRAAEKWASFALRNHTAPLLVPALQIASAISEYISARALSDKG